MSSVNQQVLAAYGAKPEKKIGYSLRFNGTNSRMTVTTPTPTSANKWTWNGWVKRSEHDANGMILGSNSANNDYFRLMFLADGTLTCGQRNTSSVVTGQYTTIEKFNDVTAWYNIHLIYDTAQAVAADRLQIWVNGVKLTITTNTALPLNQTPHGSFATTKVLGAYVIASAASQWIDGYMSNVHCVDGQALLPSEFGFFNDFGKFVAKEYAGSYGIGGYKLEFINGASVASLGTDTSGNNNNFTMTAGFVRQIGVTDSWMFDSPSQNFATLDPDVPTNTQPVSAPAPSLGALNVSLVLNSLAIPTIPIKGGKYYVEMVCTSGIGATNATQIAFGVISTFLNGSGSGIIAGYMSDGRKLQAGAASAYGASYINGDVIGCVLDAAANTMEFFKNGVSQGIMTAQVNDAGQYAYLGAEVVDIYAATAGTRVVGFNYGQRTPSFAGPAGFVGLNANTYMSNTIVDTGDVYCNGTADNMVIFANAAPVTVTVNGVAITPATGIKRATGFKLISATFTSGIKAYTAEIKFPKSKSQFKHNNAQLN
jgi:hypothetical protein